jgi:hypothetical protein
MQKVEDVPKGRDENGRKLCFELSDFPNKVPRDHKKYEANILLVCEEFWLMSSRREEETSEVSSGVTSESHFQMLGRTRGPCNLYSSRGKQGRI